MYTSRQCTYALSKQVWGNGQFQRANDDTDNNFFSGKSHYDEWHSSLYWWWNGYRVFQEQIVMMRATSPSVDGNKDLDKFNSEYKNNIPNAETSDVKKFRNQNHSITITMWTVSYIFVSPSMLNLNCRCWMWELKMTTKTSVCFTSWLARLWCWLTGRMYYVRCVLNHSEFLCTISSL